MTAATILGGAIGDGAFYGCTGLLSVNFGGKVTNVGNSIAFYGCTALTRFEVSPENAAYSSLDGVLYNKDRTELLLYPLGKTDNSFAIPGTVTTLAESAFQGSRLSSITLPESLTTIGDWALGDCPNLTTLAIPRNVTNISTSAFNLCTGLTAFEVAPENPVYVSADDILYNIDKTTIVRYPPNKANVSFTLPASVVEIARYAFRDCLHLSSLSTPGVIIVGVGAFAWSGIKSVTLAKSVIFINIYAFSGCTDLTDLTVFWDTPSEVIIPVTDSPYDDIFYGIDKSAVNLHVPPGTKAAYQADDIWTGFNIMDDATGIDDIARSVVAACFNPATGLVAINGLQGNERIHLYNINGQLLFTCKAAGETQNIPVGHWPQGVYLIHVNGQTMKIIK
jgi:hypothetical protein